MEDKETLESSNSLKDATVKQVVKEGAEATQCNVVSQPQHPRDVNAEFSPTGPARKRVQPACSCQVSCRTRREVQGVRPTTLRTGSEDRQDPESIDHGMGPAENSVDHGMGPAENSVDHGMGPAENSVDHGMGPAENSVDHGMCPAENSVDHGMCPAESGTNKCKQCHPSFRTASNCVRYLVTLLCRPRWMLHSRSSSRTPPRQRLSRQRIFLTVQVSLSLCALACREVVC